MANLARRIHRASLALGLALLAASAVLGMGESLLGAGMPPPIVYHDARKQARELAAKGDFAGAARQYEALCELGLHDLAACHASAEALGRSGDSEGELAAYRKALERFPLHSESHARLGLALLRRNRSDEAHTVLTAAVRLRPNDVKALAMLGTLLRSQGRLAEAAEAYERALRASPADASIHNELGTVYGSAGRYDLAVEHFAAASRLDPGLLAAQQNLRLARESLDRATRAR